MNKLKKSCFLLSVMMTGLAVYVFSSGFRPILSWAQESSPPPASSAPETSVLSPAAQSSDQTILELRRRAALINPQIDPLQIPSLLFTKWEYKLLVDAKQGFRTRPPSQAELVQEVNPEEPRPMGPREISLSGIVYVNSSDWTVWLNDTRITPLAIPEEVIDLKVRKDHIDLKWYDAYTNQIFPIRLRAHQRFNLDSRIFLPGKA